MGACPSLMGTLKVDFSNSLYKKIMLVSFENTKMKNDLHSINSVKHSPVNSAKHLPQCPFTGQSGSKTFISVPHRNRIPPKVLDPSGSSSGSATLPLTNGSGCGSGFRSGSFYFHQDIHVVNRKQLN